MLDLNIFLVAKISGFRDFKTACLYPSHVGPLMSIIFPNQAKTKIPNQLPTKSILRGNKIKRNLKLGFMTAPSTLKLPIGRTTQQQTEDKFRFLTYSRFISSLC